MKLVGSKGAVRSVEFHKKKEFERKLRSLLYTILIVAILVGPIYLLRSKKLLVESIEISGQQVTEKEEIERVVRVGLVGYYFKLIPKASALFYPKDIIELSLEESIPRLASVNVSRSGFKSLKVEVSEREPHALYCSNIDTEETCYFIDKTGYIYSEAPSFTDGVYLVYESDPVIESPIAKNFLSQVEFERINDFILGLKKLELKPKKLLYKNGDYYLELLSDTEVRWSADQDLKKVLVDLESFLKGSKMKLSEIEAFPYLDLRIDSKIYFKKSE